MLTITPAAENAAESTDDEVDDLTPFYAPFPLWTRLSGIGRTSTYAALDRGDLRAIKAGKRTLIDVRHGLKWLRSLPAAEIGAKKKAGQ